MDNLKKIASDFLYQSNADSLAVGIVNFATKSFDCFELEQDITVRENKKPELYFDLASVSKPLTNSLGYFSKPDIVNDDMQLVLNHRGGLPAWGLLPNIGWEDIILSYPIKSSDTLYSDYSANRFMLEFNKKSDLKAECQKTWDKEVLHWLDLTKEYRCPQFGFKHSKPNIGAVHDPNAYNTHSFMSHAGLFGTINGVCQTLLNMDEKFGFLAKVTSQMESDDLQYRFAHGWDRVENPDNTVAGKGCSKHTFGHLGFTGTSVWIDPSINIAHIILTNATKFFWYDKKSLEVMRRQLGEIIWVL
jgi:hypothetical protein